MLENILRFILGTITLKATKNTEKLLNEIYKQEIKIWGLVKTDEISIEFIIFKNSYNKILSAAQKTHTDINIQSYNGLTHLIRGYKKRYGFVVGGVLSAILFYISTLFIWNIEIKGCENTSRAEILLMLEKAGLSEADLKMKLNVKAIENSFLSATDKISWIAVNLKGTTAYVEIREIDAPPELIDAKEPCSIYASRDGVLASINTYMGYNVLSVGDTVTAGDLIVTGNYTNKYGEEFKLHSYAKVMAYTIHSKSVTVPFKSIEHIKTGRYKNKYSLKLIRFNIPLYFNKKIIYNKYDKTVTERKFKLGNSLYLPFSIVKTTYSEVMHVENTKSEQVALTDAYEKLYDFEYGLVGITVLDRQYQKSITDDGVTVKAILECYEDIGVVGKLE